MRKPLRCILAFVPVGWLSMASVAPYNGTWRSQCGADGQFRVRRDELGEVLGDVAAGLSNDLKVSDHGILIPRTPAELGLAQTGCIVFDPMDGFEDVVQKTVQLK